MPRFTRTRITLATLVAAATTATGLAVAQAASAANDTASAVVTTTTGAVQGNVTNSYREFDGIPYAAPPTGALRWAPPQPAKSWTGVKDATKPGSDCVQTAVAWRPAAASTDENCLFANVWTPIHGSDLPVAVWFYGGGYINGAGRDFQPVGMVTQGNMIVVTVNYRLGALGYLDVPGLTGNYGLLDQIQALTWVKQNIQAFGGNPDDVMIGGQSAGAGSVCDLLASPRAQNLFSRAVVESGGTCTVTTPQAAAQADTGFASALGCAGASELACLEAKPASDILNAQQKAGDWSPVLEPGILPEQPATAFTTGAFNHVPVLIGGTLNENRAFIYEQNDLINQPVTAAQYASTVDSAFGAQAATVLAHYPVSDYGNVPGAALSAVDTDSAHSCPELNNAAELTKTVPTYVFEFRDSTAPLRPYELVPSSFSLATQHSSELPYLWGSNTMVPLTATQQHLASQMIAYWAQFARTGELNPAGLPAVPRYEASTHDEVAFNPGQSAIVTNMATIHQCSFWATNP